MRFLLRDGSRQVLVFSRRRFADFLHLEDAAEFIYRYAEDPKNAEALRELLLEDPDFAHLASADPATLATRVAQMIRVGRLNVLPHPDALPPWSWPFALTPTHPVETAEAEAESNPLTALEDALEDAVDDRVDVHPDPVVPPEFPRMAKREGESIEQESKFFGFRLDEMRHFAERILGDSEIAPSLAEVAAKQGISLLDEVKGRGSELLPLAIGGMPPADGSTISGQFKALADQQGAALKDQSGRTVDVLETLNKGPRREESPSGVAPVLLDLAASQGTTLKKGAQAVGEKLASLVGGVLSKPDPSTVSKTLRGMAGETAEQVVALAKGAGHVLQPLLEGTANPPPSTTVAPAFQELGGQQSEQLVAAASATAQSLELAKPSPEEQAREPKLTATGVCVNIFDEWGQPLASQSFVIDVRGKKFEGSTDENGRALLDGLPRNGKGTLTLTGQPRPWRDNLGRLPGPTIHTVKKGDWLSKIAKKYGFKSWQTIYQHPANAAFRLERPDPNVIQPGDKIYIPDHEPRQVAIDVGAPISLTIYGFEKTQHPKKGPPPPYQPDTDPYESEPPPPPKIKPKPAPAKSGWHVLIDAKTGLLYRVPEEMYHKMVQGHEKLEHIRAGIKKANALPAGQREGAVEAKTEELRKLCEPEGGESEEGEEADVEGWKKVQDMPDFKELTPIREFIEPRSMRIMFTPERLQREIEAAHHGKWSKERLKDIIEVHKGEQESEEEEHEESKVEFEIKYRLTDWEEQLKGEGSLMDLIESAHPARLRFLLLNPAMAPLALLEVVNKKFPGFLTKDHKGGWDWSDKAPNLKVEAEARFLRWASEAQDIEFVIDPKKKELKLGGKVGGTLDLASGKVGAALALPDYEGVTLPVPTTDGSEFKVRLIIEGSLSGFVGATAQLSVEALAGLKGSHEHSKPAAHGGGNHSQHSAVPIEVGVQGGLQAFAGVKVTAEAALDIQWMSLEKHQWKSLAKGAFEASFVAGLAAEAVFNVGWDPEKHVFVLEVKCGLALEIGGGGKFKAEVDANECITFIGEMLHRADYAKIASIAADAFIAYTKFCIGAMINPVGTATSLALKAYEAFAGWSGHQGEIHDLAVSIDNGERDAQIRNGSPEVWAALISKLCDRSAFLSDETEERAICRIVEAIPSRRALENTLERIVPGKKSVGAGISKIEGTVDWGESDRFQAVLQKYGVE